MDPRTNLVAKIIAQGLPSHDRPLPIVPLEDFFVVGNDDFGSIGCNLVDHSGPQVFFKKLKEIRDRPTVQDVLVEINEVAEDPQTWPFSDRIYILTSSSLEDVKEWVATLQPDEVERGWAKPLPTNAPALQKATNVYAVWWD